jgi:hypothetical protein
MKTKDGRVRIECERGRTKFSEVKYREVLARDEEAKQKAKKKGTGVQARALHAKTA